MILPFKHPFSMLIAGPSYSGKTTFTLELLKNLDCMVDEKINKVIWCYGENNAKRKINGLNIDYRQGIPDVFENKENKPILVILDDLMMENSKSVCELFIKGSHHRNMSVILTTQNIFHQGPYARDVSLNAKYIVLMKNPRDQAQFNHLARQIYPENSKELVRIYKEATHNGYSYILFDLTQDTNDSLRYRTNIFNKDFIECYCTQKLLKRENGVENETINGEQGYLICVKKG